MKLLRQRSELQAIQLASLKQNRSFNAQGIASVLRFTQEAGPFFFTPLCFARGSFFCSLSASDSLCFARDSTSTFTSASARLSESLFFRFASLANALFY
nr:hypothetical protein [uncultured Bacteroides sp.]